MIAEVAGASVLSLHAYVSVAVTGTLIVKGGAIQQDRGVADDSLMVGYTLPDGCLHTQTSEAALGVWAAGEGRPVEVTATAELAFLVQLTGFARYLQLSWLVDADGDAGGLDVWLQWTVP